MESSIASSKSQLGDKTLTSTEGTDNHREQWSSKVDFVLSAIGLCVGLGNIWRFPYLCYENGGGAFLIPYLLTLVFAGVPILLLELMIGQMKSIGGLGVWKYCLVFKGVGYAAVIMAFWLSIYYIVILAYAFVYMFNSFTLNPLPWSDCNHPWNTQCCNSDNNVTALCNNSDNGILDSKMKMNFSHLCTECKAWNSPVLEFWERFVLGESSGIETPGSIQWQLALALLFAWILCYFCIWKGVKWTGKIVYFTALFPYVLLLCLFIRGMTLTGSAEGIKFYLKPNISKLKESKVWLDGATQIFFSYGLGLGTHIALGSYNKYKNNCHRDALIIGVVNASTSLFAGFVVFSVMGFMAHQQNKEVKDVVKSGQGLIFLVYPSALAQLPGSAFWSILFFLMIIFLGLDSQFCTLEGFLTAIIDEWPHKFRQHRKLLLFVVCGVSYLIGLSMVTQGGAYVFRLFDHYSASGMALLFLIFCQCIAFSWCYGINRFIKDCNKMLGFSISKWWKFCWLIFSPLVCMFVLIFSVLSYEHVKYKDKEYATWAHAIGIFLALSSVIMIPGYIFYYTFQQIISHKNEKSILEILRDVFQPTNEDITDKKENIQMIIRNV
uniref:Transporter n=1 Tax=Schmidtea mediterranea TaxID=79327 RepID=A0A0H3YIU2_SCHMD|nr:slc6a-1 [Schmidtea mediterranea]